MNRYLMIALFAAIVVAIFSAAALAQEPDTTVGLGGFFAGIQPYIVELVAILIAALTTWIAALVKKYTGITVEASHREAFQTALQNGVNYGLSKVSGKTETWSVDVKNEVLAEGLEYVLESVPDALKFFNLTPDEIRKKLEAKLSV